MTVSFNEPIRVVDFDPASRVEDQRRLAALVATRLCDTPPERCFDELIELIIDLLGVPVALVSLVDGHRQFFKAQQGLPEPTASKRETPLSHSFCQYVVAGDAPLVIDDARNDPTLASNGAVADLGVIAYAGFPIDGPDGQSIGSLCAIDSAPRTWTEADLGVLARLASVVSGLIEFRSDAMQAEDRQATIRQLVDSQEVERGRVAAELHDDTLQVLSALSIRLQLVSRRAESGLADDIDDLVGSVGDAAKRIRRVVTGLRPETLGNDPLAVVLAEHLEWIRESHSLVDVRLGGSASHEPDRAAAVTLFRIAQQAISNALTHGAPKALVIEVCNVGDRTELRVVDDGSGFDRSQPAPSGHYGLTIMSERAKLVGGSLVIETAPGEGTVVIASVPTETHASW